jgi:hypothetical protein
MRVLLPNTTRYLGRWCRKQGLRYTFNKAVTYFKASYDAALLLENKYSLYKKVWAAGDKEAQYQNYVNMFFDESSPRIFL